MRATIIDIKAYELHGTQYFQLILKDDKTQRLIDTRLSSDMINGDLQAGDAVEVHALLGIVDRVTKIVSDVD
tara:strand:+ start:344 stop:559 length:216 start_codon:yes stop_codon:yes gene_type:complete